MWRTSFNSDKGRHVISFASVVVGTSYNDKLSSCVE